VPPHIDLINRKLLDIATGRLRRLMLFMPPRHGKSTMVSHYFPAWYLGRFPDRRVLLTTYAADFALSWGRKARDVMMEYGDLFGVRLRADSAAAHAWDLLGREGGMTTAGVGGPITGKGADILIIDDPVKNEEEANSPIYREKVWEWYRSTAYTRLEPGGSLILVMTRWHEDDLSGRILDQEAPLWDVVMLPAVAETSIIAGQPVPDQLGRPDGQALWPERYDEAALSEIELSIRAYWWAALYQQRPRHREGGMFQRQWFTISDEIPIGLALVRFWDLGGSRKGDWTAGVLMGRAADNRVCILDVKRMRGTPGEVEALVIQTAALDGRNTTVCIEQEPGSSGVYLVDQYIRKLIGYRVLAKRPTGPKDVRAEPLSSYAQAGNVWLRSGRWNEDFLDELEGFPHGAHDDQVDGAAGAYEQLSQMFGELDTAAMREAKIEGTEIQRRTL